MELLEYISDMDSTRIY